MRCGPARSRVIFGERAFSPGPMKRKLMNWKLWLVVIAVAIIVALRALGVAHYISVDELRANRQELVAFVDGHYTLASIAYVAIYALSVTFWLPCAFILTVTGGFLFGALAGAIYAVIGASCGAIAVFLFARTVFGERALERFGPRAKKLASSIRSHAWSYLLVLRLVPLFPFFLVNLIPALVGVRLGTYVFTTVLGIIPGTAVFAVFGAGLGDFIDNAKTVTVSSVLTPNVVLGLTGLALLSVAAIALRRRFSASKPSERLST